MSQYYFVFLNVPPQPRTVSGIYKTKEEALAEARAAGGYKQVRGPCNWPGEGFLPTAGSLPLIKQ